jgi:hypothetical protein
VPLGERALDDEVPALDITQVAERVQNRLPPEWVAAEGYKPDTG